jgi:hypothetical protein
MKHTTYLVLVYTVATVLALVCLSGCGQDTQFYSQCVTPQSNPTICVVTPQVPNVRNAK